MSLGPSTSHRKHKQRPVDSIDCRPANAFAQLWEALFELAQLLWIEAPSRQSPACAVEGHRSRAADQPHRPFESSIGQRDRILA